MLAQWANHLTMQFLECIPPVVKWHMTVYVYICTHTYIHRDDDSVTCWQYKTMQKWKHVGVIQKNALKSLLN